MKDKDILCIRFLVILGTVLFLSILFTDPLGPSVLFKKPVLVLIQLGTIAVLLWLCWLLSALDILVSLTIIADKIKKTLGFAIS